MSATNRYTLRTLDLGDGAPFAVGDWAGSAGPVLAIHGVSSTHKLWAWTAAQAPDTRIVAPDLRGRGGSVGVGGSYNLRAHADDMLRVLDALDIERVTVAGMSLGGFIAVALTTAAPDRVSNLLLVDGGLPMRPPIPDLKPEQLPVVMASRLQRLDHAWSSVDEYGQFFRESMGALLDGHDATLDDYFAYDLDGQAPELTTRLDPEALLDDSADVFFGNTAEDALLKVATPTRLLYAEWSLGKDTPPAYTADGLERWSATLPAFSAELVPGTDHASIVMTDAGAAAIARELRHMTTR